MTNYIIVFDDGYGLCVPAVRDPDCDGALCFAAEGDVAGFTSRDKAQRAIRISKAHAKLQQAQGKPLNTDFTESAKCIKIRKVTSDEEE